MATPSGARAIGSLKVGDKVLAYNPTTGKSEAEPVQHVWRNHDHDLVDVQLTTTDTTKTSDTTRADRSGTTAQPPTAGKTASQAMTRLHRWVRLGALAAGLAATLLTTTVGGASAQAAPATTDTPAPTRASSGETINTTANHPWLTSDRGWVPAGDLQPGEGVVTLDGAASTVAWVHVVPGAGEMDNLTVARVSPLSRRPPTSSQTTLTPPWSAMPGALTGSRPVCEAGIGNQRGGEAMPGATWLVHCLFTDTNGALSRFTQCGRVAGTRAAHHQLLSPSRERTRAPMRFPWCS